MDFGVATVDKSLGNDAQHLQTLGEADAIVHRVGVCHVRFLAVVHLVGSFVCHDGAKDGKMMEQQFLESRLLVCSQFEVRKPALL